MKDFIPALDQLVALMRADDWRGALKLAARWPQLGTERKAITQGWEAYARPAWYLELRKDPTALQAEGKAALLRRYGHHL